MGRLRKAVCPPNLDSIPAELRAVPRWVVWDYFPPEKAGGKERKKPLQIGADYGIDYTDPAEWNCFEKAVADARKRGGLGIGFVFAEDDDLVGVDLDACLEPQGVFKPWGKEILDRFSATWAEESPSGTGVHFIGRADRIVGKTKTKVSETEAVERYSQSRWFTFSGRVVNAAPVADIRQPMEWLEERYFRRPKQPAVERATLVRRSSTKPSGEDHELDVALAQVCLGYLSPATAADGDLWRRAGYAAKRVGEECREPWKAFSRLWPDNDEAELDDRWDRFDPDTAGLQTLIGMAIDDSGKLPRDLINEARQKIGRGIARAETSQGGAGTTTVTVRPAGVTVQTGNEQGTAAGPICVSDPQTWNELAFARRLVRDAAGEILYVADRGVWMAWAGTHWREDREALHAQRIAKAIASRLWEEIATAPQQIREAAGRFAAKASSRRTIEAAIALAKSEPGVSAVWSDFNRDPDLLNCKNGTLDLADDLLRLRPHRKEDRLTQIAGVDFDETASAPRWKRFVSDVTLEDDDLAAFLQRSFGIALTADQSEQRLWVHHGDGGNGKGTFLSVVAKVLGTYAGPVSADVFVSKRDRERDIAMAQLVGKRLAFAQESDDGARLLESSVKAATGSDVCTARYLYQNPFQVTPTWHIHLAVNHRPAIKGRDAGIWRRVLLVPWRAVFDGAQKRDRAEIEAELFAEGAGILNWMIAGFAAWKAGGLRPPEAVQVETGDYKRSSDSVAAWIDDACKVDDQAATGSTDLFVSYKDWCYRAGFDALTQTSFGRALEEMGYHKDRPTTGIHRNKVVRKGLALAPTSSWA